MAQDLYRANKLPCPDMQLLLQYCDMPVGDRSCMVPMYDRINDSDYAIPHVVEDARLECEPIALLMVIIMRSLMHMRKISYLVLSMVFLK